MAAIDRLGWAAGFSFEVHGLRIGLRATRAEFLEEARERLPPGARACDGPLVDHVFSAVVGDGPGRRGTRHFNLLYLDAGRVTRTLHRETLLGDLERYVEETLLLAAPGRLFVHSGAVAWRGMGLVLPGVSGSGKSSLVAELVRAGAEYFSDEYAVIDQQGRLHPYPRALKLRDEDGERSLTAHDLGGRAATSPVTIGLLAFLQFQPGSSWEPRRLSPGSATLALLRNTPGARSEPGKALALAGAAARRALAIEAQRGEAAGAAARLIEALESVSARLHGESRDGARTGGAG
jgi:hypothetical protein